MPGAVLSVMVVLRIQPPLLIIQRCFGYSDYLLALPNAADSPRSCLYHLAHGFRPFAAQYSVFLSGQLMVIHKEPFQFAAELFAQIVQRSYILPTVSIFLN